MRRFTAAFAAAAVMAAVPLGALATHGGPDDRNPRDWANGGGQVVLSGDDLEGAGDTVAFSATTLPNTGGVEGQVQYVATSLAGQEMGRWHGVVDCLEVDGNTATLGGAISATQGSTETGRFSLTVTDNGTPNQQGGLDVIMLTAGPDTAGDCSGDDGGDELTLARGNATVHDAG